MKHPNHKPGSRSTGPNPPRPDRPQPGGEPKAPGGDNPQPDTEPWKGPTHDPGIGEHRVE